MLVLWWHLTCLGHGEHWFACITVWFACAGWQTARNDTSAWRITFKSNMSNWIITCKCDIPLTLVRVQLGCPHTHEWLGVVTSHWLFLTSSLGTQTSTGNVKTWGPLGVMASHWLFLGSSLKIRTAKVTLYWPFSGSSLGIWTSTNDVKTWRPVAVVTSHWLFRGPAWGCEDLKTTWGCDLPLALFKV